MTVTCDSFFFVGKVSETPAPLEMLETTLLVNFGE